MGTPLDTDTDIFLMRQFVLLTGFITLCKMSYRREVKRGKKLREQKGISQQELLITEV